MPASAFPGLLAEQLRRDATRPAVTFYDDASKERVELSVATFANWVNKTASLVQDELGLGRGDSVLLDVPVHWLVPVWLGAAWTAGLCVTSEPSADETADLVVCGPDGVAAYADAGRPVMALSLRPLGGGFGRQLPPGVVDYAAVVLGQPDGFWSADPPGPEDPAWRDGTGMLTQRLLIAGAGERALVHPRGRLLTDVDPCSRPGLSALLSPLLAGGGTVWVAHPDPGSWQRRYAEERATAQLRIADC